MVVLTSRCPSQLLEGPDVVAVLEQVGREGVSKRVAACRLHQTGLPDGAVHGSLDDGFVEMMPAPLAAFRLSVRPGSREQPLPGQLASRVRILAPERVR